MVHAINMTMAPLGIISLVSHYWAYTSCIFFAWWRHQMETFPALLALCAGNSPVSDAELWINGWVNTRVAGDLRRHRAHYDVIALLRRHNGHSSVSNHQPHDCLHNRLFRHRSQKTSKLRATGLCVGNSPGPVNSPHKGPVTRKMFPFDDVIMVMDKDKE